MLVLITVDVELSPLHYERHPDGLDLNIRHAYYGDRRGRWGLEDQLALLRRYGLKAVFFVEALSPAVTGLDQLREVCALIQEHGQEIQLHTHPEWLSFRHDDETASAHSKCMNDLSAAEQLDTVKLGLSNLDAVGVGKLLAHRAGAFGANRETLQACAQAGLRFDSSYNATMLGGPCRLSQEAEQTRPRWMEGIWEVPVTCFRQFGDHPRPLQLCAVSAAEMRQALVRMQRAGAPVTTLVSHSFELLTRDRQRVQPVHVSRFKALCAFLAKHRDRFTTAGFADLDPDDWRAQEWDVSPVRVNAPLTGLRYLAQAAGRVYE